ncbi:hypothetical protein CRI94_02435 [Longibacter salinarum]|uniref:Uncharacterized protein n=1 Tax=Longibacter salinarum TaxID=1850348 RepID=A0A2A8D2R1_9BACT|nr:hypothetical protein [Longibacter salinarum]PEN15161.1 hypothetical protein CRI94_02435 [Longibacter salinarum]
MTKDSSAAKSSPEPSHAHEHDEHVHDHDATSDHVEHDTSILDELESSVRERVECIAEVVDQWSDPDGERRKEAEHATLHAENLFTEEAIVFAINQFASTISAPLLASIVLKEREKGDRSEQRPTVFIEHGDRTPVDGLREVIVALTLGHPVRSFMSGASPAIVPAFLNDLTTSNGRLEADVVNRSEFPAPASDDVLILSGGEDSDEIEKEWISAGGDAARVIRAAAAYSVAIVDGSEPEDERHNLAEDALLHEGQATASLKVLWAPEDLTPDPILQAMADFRGVFPAHNDTPGVLEMQRAFLEAQDASHAYAAGMQFLVSRGAPEPQRGAHLRWSEYEDFDDVATWIRENAKDIVSVIARPSLQSRLPEALHAETLREKGIAVIDPGHVHRRPLVTHEVQCLLDVLA